MVLRIRSWRYSLEDETRSGHLIKVTHEKNVPRFRELIKADIRVTREDFEDLLKMSSTSMHNILHKHHRVKNDLCY